MMKADSSCEDCEDFEDCSPLSQFMAVALMLGCHIKMVTLRHYCIMISAKDASMTKSHNMCR